MHNIILSVAYCCNCTSSVLITCILKSSHINCLIRSLFLNPSIVVRALPLCIPFSGYIDNYRHHWSSQFLLNQLLIKQGGGTPIYSVLPSSSKVKLKVNIHTGKIRRTYVGERKHVSHTQT